MTQGTRQTNFRAIDRDRLSIQLKELQLEAEAENCRIKILLEKALAAQSQATDSRSAV
jgi:hypothetical protein